MFLPHSRTSLVSLAAVMVLLLSFAPCFNGLGAEDSAGGDDHWAFLSPERPQLPEVRDASWPNGALDVFVLAHLEKAQIRPASAAVRAAFMRRLFLDLLGLPPSPGEIDAFLADGAPDAADRLVDRLLASPHFGERWGRHWLDLARYADSDGYTLDSPRPWAWRWRDWVIEALNQDMPFDEFTVEQLAGDLLPNATTAQKVATGFHRNTLRNAEGGVDQEEYRVRAVVDRVNTTGTVWLGLTIGCAQCHNHKYDPLTQREFYEFFAFFNSDAEEEIPAPLPRELEDYDTSLASFDAAGFEAETKRLEKAIKQSVGRLSEKTAEWKKTVRPSPTKWSVLRPKTYGATGSRTEMNLLPDGSMLIGGPNTFFNNFTLVYDTDLEGITALRLEVLPDPSQPVGGPGRHPEGNFLLSEFRAAVAPRRGLDPQPGPTPVTFERAVTNFGQVAHEISTSLDGDTDTGWSVAPSVGRHHTAVYFPTRPIGGPGGSELTIGLDHNEHTIGKFRLLATTEALSIQADSLSESQALPYPVVEILRKETADETEAETKRLYTLVETIDPEIRRLRNELAEHKILRPRPPRTQARTLALRGKRKTHIHIRGDFQRKGDEVTAGTPAVLPRVKRRGEVLDRLDLAHWIVDGENPLSGRVLANRLWQRLFGKGLVATADDFGTRGELPSHGLLLDWLGREVIRLEWSQKSLIRRIVTSRTYRQSSRHRPELATRDPGNQLLARQNRYRLEAEVIRDLGLTVGGLMMHRIGGPSVRPALPGNVGDIGFANLVDWKVSAGEDQYRRGLYIFTQRTVPYPMLSTFDAPEATVTCTRRETSNTPLHALFLLNDHVFLDFARGVARRLVEYGPADRDARLRHAYQLCLTREPDAGRLDSLRAFHGELETVFNADSAAAAEFSGLEPATSADNARVTEIAVWTAIARVLMNTDRYVTRE